MSEPETYQLLGQAEETIAGLYERIAQLEAALAEKEPALAAAHEALDQYGMHDEDCNNAYRVASFEPQNCSCGLAAALSVPALQRAAKLDGLRRKVCEDVGLLRGHLARWGEAGSIALLVDHAALRAEEGKG